MDADFIWSDFFIYQGDNLVLQIVWICGKSVWYENIKAHPVNAMSLYDAEIVER